MSNPTPQKLYAERDPIQLDKDGSYYFRHVEHMTTERLFSKSDIAAELGYRDREIDRLRKELEEVERVVTDTERLNWLIAHSAYVSYSRDGEVCNVWYRFDPNDDAGDSVPVQGFPQKNYSNPRDAIDACMKGNND